jgi:hypothetical protein
MYYYNYLVLGVPGKPLACAGVGHGSVSLNDYCQHNPHCTIGNSRETGGAGFVIVFLILLVWKLETVTDMMARVLCVCRQQCHLA